MLAVTIAVAAFGLVMLFAH